MSQPWPIVGGNALSASVGFAVGAWLGHGVFACGLAVGLAIALMSVTRSLHPPGGAAALTGGTIAARQSWMQINPPLIPECGPGLEFMLESFPLAQALPMIFRGAGDCTCLLYTSPSPRDRTRSRMPSSA